MENQLVVLKVENSVVVMVDQKGCLKVATLVEKMVVKLEHLKVD
jgi:hypothetical protein